jgi:hypothetical protein
MCNVISYLQREMPDTLCNSSQLCFPPTSPFYEVTSVAILSSHHRLPGKTTCQTPQKNKLIWAYPKQQKKHLQFQQNCIIISYSKFDKDCFLFFPKYCAFQVSTAVPLQQFVCSFLFWHKADVKWTHFQIHSKYIIVSSLCRE